MLRVLPSSLAALALVLGCGDANVPEVGAGSQSVIYGRDDRVEVFEHPDARMREIAVRSVVAIIPDLRLERSSRGEYSVPDAPLGEALGLCPDERFVDQPTAAECSGVLVDEDLVLTAGHCIRDEIGCQRSAIVFNYRMVGPQTAQPIEDDDVYWCADLALQQFVPGVVTPDFAFVKLDRPVIDAHPIEIRQASELLEQGEPLTVIASSDGTPLKIDDGGSAIDPRTGAVDFFLANIDAFAGSSGAPVLDADYRLTGIAVAGPSRHYVQDPSAGCRRVEQLGEEEAASFIQYAARPLELLCGQEWPSEALCGISSVDGDPEPPIGMPPPPQNAPEPDDEEPNLDPEPLASGSSCSARPVREPPVVGFVWFLMVVVLGARKVC